MNRPLSQEQPASVVSSDALMSGEPPAATDHVFECAEVSLEFETPRGPLTVLENVGFTVASGEFVSIVGQSGTGKSTLLRILGGLQRAAEGSASCIAASRSPRHPTASSSSSRTTAARCCRGGPSRSNVALGLERLRRPPSAGERVPSALDLVGLADRAQGLSVAALRRDAAAGPDRPRPGHASREVLLMDEPFGALDAMTKAQLQDELAACTSSRGATIVFVTHDIEEAVYLERPGPGPRGHPGAASPREVDVSLDRPRDQITTKELPDYLRLRTPPTSRSGERWAPRSLRYGVTPRRRSRWINLPGRRSCSRWPCCGSSRCRPDIVTSEFLPAPTRDRASDRRPRRVGGARPELLAHPLRHPVGWVAAGLIGVSLGLLLGLSTHAWRSRWRASSSSALCRPSRSCRSLCSCSASRPRWSWSSSSTSACGRSWSTRSTARDR